MNKKILAILMALLMVAMSATAFAAANDTVNVVEETSFDLTKTYTGAGAPAETFKFTLGGTDQGNYPLTLSSETISFDGPQSADAAAKVVTVTVPAVGGEGGYPAEPKTYNYTITETVENPTAGIAYDKTEYAVKVTVYNASAAGTDPVYKTTISIKAAGASAKSTEAAFANTYSATSMTVKKQITGNAANMSDTFEITVTFSNPADSTLKSAITSSVSDQTVTVTPSEDGKTFVIGNIGHNDVVTFSNLPVGTHYSVVETANAYDATYSDAAVEDKVVAKDAGTNVVVTNTKTDDIDTGVFTDNMPYFMLMAFVMMLAAAVVLKKRTVNE